MTPSPPLPHHATTPNSPPTLAELVAKARHPKQPKTAELEPHREELLRLRRAGESVEVLARALRGMGVEISSETLRLWLNRHLRRKTAKREHATGAIAPQAPRRALPQSESKTVGPSVAAAADDAATTVATPTGVAIKTAPASPAPLAAVSTASASSPSASSPQSGTGSGTAEPAKSYTPWKNNFTPLIIDSRSGEPQKAPGDS